MVLKLYCISLVDATRVDPKVSQAILLRLLCTELELLVTVLAASGVIVEVFECDFLLAPGVRENRIERKCVAVIREVCSKTESTSTVALQETHRFGQFRLTSG
jgi:hypothetical protein